MSGSIPDYIRAFRSAAIKKGDGLGGPRDRHLYDQLVEAYNSLLDSGAQGRQAFKELLNDDSAHVRGWAAAALLYEGDSEARPILEAIREMGGMTGFEAEVTLQEYDAGRLGPPLRRRGA